MIKAQNITFDYPGKRALDKVSFSIKKETITAIVGPNGAGKTTLLRCMAALDSPTTGNITIDGFDTEKDPRNIHQLCSYLSDFFGLYEELTVRQCLTYIAWSQGIKGQEASSRVADAIDRLELNEYQDAQANSLSRGLKQRLAIAQAIVQKSTLLILDEPASGLDPKARVNLSNLLIQLKNDGITIVVSSHILAELEDYCTDMIILEKGKIIQVEHLTQPSAEQENLYQLTLSKSLDIHLESIKAISALTIVKEQENGCIVRFASDIEPNTILKQLMGRDIPVTSFSPVKQKMQDIYMNLATSEGGTNDES